MAVKDTNTSTTNTEHNKTNMWQKVSRSPLVFLLPAAFVCVFAIAGVARYQSPEIDTEAFAMPEVPSPAELTTKELPEERDVGATLEITMPDAAREGKLKDGTYSGSALCGLGNDEDWQPYYVIVEIEVKDGKVSSIKDIRGDTEGSIDPQYVYDSAENSIYLSRAIKGTGGRFSKGAKAEIEALIESGDETGTVDTVSGSTYSVMSIVQAYNKAVAEAVAKAQG